MSERLEPAETEPGPWLPVGLGIAAGFAGAVLIKKFLADRTERKTQQEIADYFTSFTNGEFERQWQAYNPDPTQTNADLKSDI